MNLPSIDISPPAPTEPAVARYADIVFSFDSIGSVSWTLVPEIFPNRVSGVATAVPVLIQLVANATVVIFFPLAFSRLGKSVAFAFLAAMCAAQALIMWRFVPESKSLFRENIEEYWKSPLRAARA